MCPQNENPGPPAPAARKPCIPAGRRAWKNENLQNDPNPKIEHSPEPPDPSLFRQATSDKPFPHAPQPTTHTPAAGLRQAVPLASGVANTLPLKEFQQLLGPQS
jgi:hypothetical protein